MGHSRREFIRNAAGAGAGIVAGALGLSARSYGSILGANDRLKVGIVGFSDRAKDALLPAFWEHAEQLNCEILGVCDIWNRRREEGLVFVRGKTGQSVRSYRNNDEMYADNDLDAVIISTPDFQHALHAAEAARNKKHAYVEKPFAETMEDNRLALAEVRSSGIVLQVGSQRRSSPTYRKAAEFIASGKFGDITMVEMSWNVNQPGRWRRPALVADIRESDTDWKRFLMNRPFEPWDPRKYIEFRLFWPYSSGIPGQWMCHQIDTVHWFTGHRYPRSVVANGGIYKWDDGRKNFDTMTAVFDFGPAGDPHRHGFQVVYSSRMHNSAGGVKEIYYSNGGELNLDTNRVTPDGGLTSFDASPMGMKSFLLPKIDLTDPAVKADAPTSSGVELMTSLHVRNWLESVRDGRQPNAPVEAGYSHAVSTIMTNAALRTGKAVTFDEQRQEVLAGGEVFGL
jgi:predicted dehydrogenase